MSHTHDLLTQLRQERITLALDGDRLKVRAPAGTLTPDLRQQLACHKTELIALLGAAQSTVGAEIPLRTERHRPLPLSCSQQSLWLQHQLDPDSPLFLIPIALRLRGPLDPQRLELALNTVIARQESLRTRFVILASGDAAAVIDTPAFRPLPVEEVTAAGRPLDAVCDALVSAALNEPMNLEQGPLLRLTLYRLAGEEPAEWLLAGALHHLVSDAWSINLLIREIIVHYAAQPPEPASAPALPRQFQDFAAWEQAQIQSGAWQAQLAFWRRELAGASLQLRLPTDHPPPATPVYRHQRCSLLLPRPLSDELARLCGELGLTPFMGYFAAWSLLLAGHSGQTEFCVVVPSTNRPFRCLDPLIGFFANLLVVRNQIHRHYSLRQHLLDTRARLLNVFEHQQVPFRQVLEQLPRLGTTRQSLPINSGFQYQDFTSATGGGDDAALLAQWQQLTGIELEPLQRHSQLTPYDLFATVIPGPHGIAVHLDFNAALFAQAGMQQLLARYQQLLRILCANPQQRVDMLVPALTQPQTVAVIAETATPDSAIPYATAEQPTPPSALEQALLQRWRQLLPHTGHIGHHDDFFALGGNSLQATRLLLQLRKELNRTIRMRDFVDHPTVHWLARQLEHPDSAPVTTAPTPLPALAFPAQLPPMSSTPSRHILLTGANGFLGVFLLRALVELGADRISCLVRAATREQALVRLQEACHHYRIDFASLEPHIGVLAGDLAQPRLGLAEQDWTQLCESVDLILHNGARVNMMLPLHQLAPTNIGGTAELLTLAFSRRLKPLHYVSTHSVHRLYQDSNADASGYTRSKFLAEQLLLQGRVRGIPITIHRPGQLFGDTRHGACNPNDLFYQLLKICQTSGCAPRLPTRIPLLPVDTVARHMAQVALQQPAANQDHALTGIGIGVDELLEGMRRYGYGMATVEFTHWQQQALRVVEGEPALQPLTSLIQDSHTVPPAETVTTPSASQADTMTAIDEPLLWRTLDYLVETGFLPPPSLSA